MDGAEIRFKLRPLDAVEQFGGPGSEETLHWFGLTDGWYEVRVGEQRLLCPEGEPDGVDYHVARIWEDLLDVFPAALDPVPASIAARLADHPAWCRWIERVMGSEELDDDVTAVALGWWHERRLSTGHLRDAPGVWLWREGDALQLRWNTPPSTEGGVRWRSPRGRAVLDVDAFRETIVAFDRALIAVMDERVVTIERGWRPPGVAIVTADLRREHEDRATWMQQCLARSHAPAHAWDDVLAALIAVERVVAR